MVSMKDISETCGVSIATVSKALNGRTDISTSTKERVLEVAKKMGYVPNSSARALKTNRTYNIGVLFADEARSGLTHSYFSPVLDSFRQGVEEKGYDITFLGRHVGKSGSNDANAEYLAEIRRAMNTEDISYQFAELGKVDIGGGGTIAYIMANHGMEVIDSGVAVLSMHAPWEVTSKADVYEAYRGYKSFLRNI